MSQSSPRVHDLYTTSVHLASSWSSPFAQQRLLLLMPASETSPAHQKPSHATLSSSRKARRAHWTPTSIELHIFCLKCDPPEREGATHPRLSTVKPACLRTQRTSSAKGTTLLPTGASSRIFRTCRCARSLHLAQTTTCLPSSVFYYPTLIYSPRTCPMRYPPHAARACSRHSLRECPRCCIVQVLC